MARPAETYTHGHHDSVLRSHRWRTAENSAAYLLPVLSAGMSILDVGCGPGTITLDLARRVAPGRVVGIDAVEAPLRSAAADAEGAGIANVEFGIGDAYDLGGVGGGPFDLVHAHHVLQHLARPVDALREMARACRPGGWIAARDADYRTIAWYPELPELDRWLELYDGVHRSNGGEPHAGAHLLAWARAAGLERVSASASTWCYATPAERSWWGDLWADRVTASDFADQAVAGGFAERSELDRIAAAWRAWSTHADAWFAITSGEILARVPSA
jgi:SAM-dependent methyltransferase